MTIYEARMVLSRASRYRNPRKLRAAAMAFLERNEWDKAQALAERATIIERRQIEDELTAAGI